jgi:hypothetical protein
MIKRYSLITAILIFGALVYIQCATSGGYVTTPVEAPALKVENRPPAPGPAYVWVEGYWAWNGHSYVWKKGKWVKRKPDYVWKKGHWKSTPRGWKWVPGKWVKGVHR